MKTKKLIIISGASRGIGKSFLDEYQKQESVMTLGLNRTGSAGYRLDLLDENATYDFVRNVPLKDITRVVYLHAIGIDKFEPQGNPHIDHDLDGIDDEVYSSNYRSFLHLAEPLIDRIRSEKIPLTVCNIGSISDIYEVPYWQSFSRAKNMVRKFCKSINDPEISNIILNVGSTLDEEKRTFGRKNVDTTYWQTSVELVKKSFETLNHFHKSEARYAEFDYFKSNPLFRKDYFTNLPELYAKWQRDLGYPGQEIPLGIRI